MRTVIEALEHRSRVHPERDALIAGARRISYGELWTRVEAAASELARCGVLPGDRVLLAAESAPAFAYGYFGAHLAGAIAVPFAPHAPAPRREELILRVAPRLVFLAKGSPREGAGGLRLIDELDSLPAGRRAPFPPPALDALADLLFTTGTTGRPKGVRLTQRNVAAAALHINSVIGTTEGDVEVVPLPLSHSGGLARLRCGLAGGATVVLVPGFRLPGEIFAALKEHRATGLCGVPAGFAMLLRFGERGLGLFAHRLRYVEIGSAPMPREHKLALMKLLPRTALYMNYGLTEASRSSFIEFHAAGNKLESAGKPSPGVEVQARGESGEACAPGAPGVLWIRGAHVSPGYWDDAELTGRTLRDGWLCTGDVAHLDEAGFIHLHGRHDDLVNVGGFNVSPEEVERVLAAHPAVLDAACIGVPDPRNIAGHVVRAYLVAAGRHAPDAELSQWMAAHLEPYKLPAQYRWVPSLPRTESGKLVRGALRQAASTER